MRSLTDHPPIPYKGGMVSSIRIPSRGAAYRLTAMLSGSGAGFSMGLILCFCGVLISCFAVLSAQIRQPEQAVASAPAASADEVFNARYYPLVDCPLFRMPHRTLRYSLPSVILAEPTPEVLPTEDPAPKIPLYPASCSALSSIPASASKMSVDGSPALQAQHTSGREAEPPKVEK